MPFDFLCCVRSGVEEVVELDYSHQSLTDVPNEVFVYERTLENLQCQSNRITELPRQLFMCHQLKYLDLSDNELQAIPAAISSLVNINYLNISRNTLSTLPDTMKALKHLTFLDLSVNPMEKLPDAITNLIALKELYLNDTYLEYLPGNFGRLVNLCILELRDNYLMILPKSLSRSVDLVRLDIGQNEFQQFPEVIGRFLKLKELWIDSNSLSFISSAIKSLENLVHLEASNNMIEDVASEIGYCTRLVDLSLSSNSLTQIPESIGELHNLTTLKLDHNRLYNLPDSIGRLSNLEELMLMNNYLDSLPSSIGLLRKLKYLNVDENMLRSIPPEIGSCTKLSVLSLRANKLNKIPPDLGHLSSLRVLNLVRNSLNSLPQSLLNCDNLVALWLSENQSKPLVPMHSEVDPHTYEQVLTCFLFPQVPLTPLDLKTNDEKLDNVDTQPVTRHITFGDLKAATKIPEKPGQLRRAPTPYPKELRALAKHARNINKDGAQDITPAMLNAVQIKAAKITPTLQQRFISDNQKNEGGSSKTNDEEENEDNMNLSVYDNIPSDNTYDKPLDLSNEQDKTYKSVDHALYSENNEVISPEHKIENEYLSQGHYDEKYCSKQELEKESLPKSPSYIENACQTRKENKYISGYNQETLGQIQRLSISSQDRRSNEALLTPHFIDNSYNRRTGTVSMSNFESAYPNRDHVPSERNYHENVYDRYIQSHNNAQLKNYASYNCQLHRHDIPSPRVHTVSQVVNSKTMPNISKYIGVYAGPIIDNNYAPSANNYTISTSSPTYLSSQTSELYSPTGHTDTTNPYRMTNTPLVSDDGSFSQTQSPAQNMYDIYDVLPSNMSNVSQRLSPNNVTEMSYVRGQPPPYHIAAPYTKHAQYFNGTGG